MKVAWTATRFFPRSKRRPEAWPSRKTTGNDAVLKTAQKSAFFCGLFRCMALALASTLSLTELGNPARAAIQSVSVGAVAPGPTYWPLYVGEEMHYFEKAGMKLDVYSSGATTAQQLVAGSLDVACSGFPDFMRATYGGASVKIFLNSIGAPPYGVYAKPTIKSVSQLKGKTISIGGVQDVTLVYVERLLATAKLTPKDVDFVYAKSAGDRFSALAGGAVDAAILNPPSSFRAAALGMSNLGDISSLMKDFPFTVWATNLKWSSQNRRLLSSFISAYLSATKWLYDPANKKQAIAILIKHAKVNQSDATNSYDYLVSQLHAFSADGKITPAAFSKMTDALLSLGDIKRPVPNISAFYDASYLTESGTKP